MPDEAGPPRKVYGLKPKEFERVNTAEPGPAAPRANDVFAIQREQREREIASGMDELKPNDRPQSKRRRRDYWLLLLGGNLALIAAALLAGLNVVTAVYVFSGVVLYSIALTWIMWFVMDDY